MAGAGTYFAKLDHFEQLFDDRVATALPFVADDPRASGEIKHAQTVIKAALQELRGSYHDQYLDDSFSPTKDDVVGLTRLEANIAMTTQQTLVGMQKLIRLESRPTPRAAKSVRTRLALRSIRKMAGSLERREDNAPLAISIGIKEMLLAGRKPVKTAVTMIGLIGLHRPVSDWPRVLDAASFFRSEDLTFEGIAGGLEQLAEHPRRAMVVIGNHDTSMYDGVLASRVARLLGTQHHILMLRKSVYPIPPPESPGDIVYVDEDDPTSFPVSESVTRVKEWLGKKDVVSIAVYPEGMLPFAGAQMPLITKDGAFLVARKLAIALSEQNVPVFLVELKSNTLTHLTQIELIPATVNVAVVSPVPSERMVKGQRDPWIDNHRVESETRFNANRGEKMVDIVSSTRVPNSITFEARGLSQEWQDAAVTSVSVQH